MGRFISWLRSKGFDVSGPAEQEALMAKIEATVGSASIEIDRLDALPAGDLDPAEVEELYERVWQAKRGIEAGIRGRPFHALTQQRRFRRRLDAAVSLAGTCAARVTEIRGRRSAVVAVQHAIELNESERGRKPAAARWAWLVPIREWALQERRDNPQGSRASFIRARLDTIRAKAKEAGEAFTPDDARLIETVEGWFRDAGIK